MVEDKKNNVPDNSEIETEESSIDRINDFVTEDNNAVQEVHSEVVDDIVDELPDEKMPAAKNDSEMEKPKDLEPKKPEFKKQEVKNNNTKNSVKSNAAYKTNKAPEPKSEKKYFAPSKPIKSVKPVVKTFKKPEKKFSKPSNIRVSNKPASKHEKYEGHKNNFFKERASKESNTWIWVTIGILLVALIIIVYLVMRPSAPSVPQDTTLAATVNGDPLYLQDLMTEYNRLDPTIQKMYSIESLMNKTIDEMLLVQEAEKRGIKASKDEIENDFEALKLQNRVDDEGLKTLLSAQGMNIDDLKDYIKRQLLIRGVLNETIFNGITITSDQIKEYYDNNTAFFTKNRQVTVRHILVMPGNGTVDEAEQRLSDARKQLNSTNFCELVKKYSDDAGSIETCGEYTFGKGQMVQEFEDAAFNMGINETTKVKTMYGWHLLLKLADRPAGLLPLSDVSSYINETLFNAQAQINFDAMVEKLKSEAVIVNYLNAQPNSTVDASATKTYDAFAKCLTGRGVKFYGAYWCPHCENQKKMFGESFPYVAYVECAEEGNPQVQTQICTDAGITGYPTWIINGKQYPGEQSLQKLSQLSGCNLN